MSHRSARMPPTLETTMVRSASRGHRVLALTSSGASNRDDSSLDEVLTPAGLLTAQCSCKALDPHRAFPTRTRAGIPPPSRATGRLTFPVRGSACGTGDLLNSPVTTVL